MGRLLEVLSAKYQADGRRSKSSDVHYLEFESTRLLYNAVIWCICILIQPIFAGNRNSQMRLSVDSEIPWTGGRELTVHVKMILFMRESK
ncbi:hypothetical protein Mapa_012902 [Marchantia paleacea]|nr:hypothetical protein Mapa_012902 [Marchantia paleacea]